MAETLKVEKDTKLTLDAGFKVKKKTKGNRLPDQKYKEGDAYPVVDASPGDYWKVASVSKRPDQWWIVAPVKGGSPFRLNFHTVTEHEDGTITASPSLMVFNAGNRVVWHGHLRKGVFEELDA